MVPILVAIIIALLLALAVFLVMLFQGRSHTTRLAILQTENARLLPLQGDNERLKIENATLLQRIEAEKDKTGWVETAETKLREAFNSLAADALKGNSNQFIEQSKQQIDSFVKQLKGDWSTQKEQVEGIVKPLNEDLGKLEKQVQELEQNRKEAYGSLLTEVTNLKKAHETLNLTATQLHDALKSPTARGKWGQIALRNVAEMSGMVAHIDFDEQQTTEAGDRPDMIVYLPNSGVIPVDAKAPMDSYLAAVEATDANEKIRLLQAHRLAVRAHVKALSKKGYWKNFDKTADFVVMFMPYESSLEASFSEDPGILKEALESKVIIVSPSTLLALLKVIALGWLQLQLAKNAQAIADQGKELMDRVCRFVEYFADVGKKLNGSLESYNKAVGSFDSRVMPSLRKLKDMGACTEEVEEVPSVENRARLIESAGTE
jgi:DNA recombination protein RmuC